MAQSDPDAPPIRSTIRGTWEASYTHLKTSNPHRPLPGGYSPGLSAPVRYIPPNGQDVISAPSSLARHYSPSSTRSYHAVITTTEVTPPSLFLQQVIHLLLSSMTISLPPTTTLNYDDLSPALGLGYRRPHFQIATEAPLSLVVCQTPTTTQRRAAGPLLTLHQSEQIANA
ncbi:hypothetical protein AAG570_001463 [Ranatra chinensis]|uniref:Uncharacterized protein n=1 Tax=Ranatra chinensis TaxID=642074 RepID=A0ABD0Y8L1_9HEMI